VNNVAPHFADRLLTLYEELHEQYVAYTLLDHEHWRVWESIVREDFAKWPLPGGAMGASSALASNGVSGIHGVVQRAAWFRQAAGRPLFLGRIILPSQQLDPKIGVAAGIAPSVRCLGGSCTAYATSMINGASRVRCPVTRSSGGWHRHHGFVRRASWAFPLPRRLRRKVGTGTWLDPAQLPGTPT
jgi:hypothetical protein